MRPRVDWLVVGGPVSSEVQGLLLEEAWVGENIFSCDPQKEKELDGRRGWIWLGDTGGLSRAEKHFNSEQRSSSEMRSVQLLESAVSL